MSFKLFALADLHLSWSTPEKKMDVFGPLWENYMTKIEKNWRSQVQKEDLVLLPGDLSWAMHLEDALVDLEWIDSLPGTKVMIKGNHDYWWSSRSKMTKRLPQSLHLVQNDAFTYRSLSIGGARLWDSPEFNFSPYIEVRGEMKEQTLSPKDEKIFSRELQRLELSLQALDPMADSRIVMTHYPPIGPDLAPSRVSALLEQYNVHVCVFGHLHSVRLGSLPYGERNGVHYHLVSADYVDFTPVRLADVS